MALATVSAITPTRVRTLVDKPAVLMRSDPPGVAHPKVTGRYPNPPWPTPRLATPAFATARATERGRLRVNATSVIRLDELEWRTTGSGGPGGQHANTSDTRVEVSGPDHDVDTALCGRRERLLERLGPGGGATVPDSRSQARNREVALERLRARLADALHVDPPRRSTKPTKSAKQSRLDDKRRQSTRKQDRRRPTGDD